MSPFWRTGPAAVFLIAVGCTGEQISGRWQGTFPLGESKACVLTLNGNNSFDLSCDGTTWIGAGRYKMDSDRLKFDFRLLHHNRELVKDHPQMSLRLDGHGNEIELSNDAGQRYILTRSL